MRYKKFSLLIIFAASLLFGSCKKDAFVELNTNPNTLYSITPQEQFMNTAIVAHGQDFEQFYDNYRRIMYWMQMSTANAGNGSVTLKTVGNFNYRYGIFYPSLGAVLTDVQELINKMPAEEQPKYQQIGLISEIPKIYYAFYVSDINGSVVYSEGFKARYGGTLTPVYESQESLFNLWDNRLKEIVTALKAAPSVTQAVLGKNDLYFGGDVSKWIKAASGLRMRMAMRLMKRNPEKMKTIVNDILSDPANLMQSNADGWNFWSDPSFTSGGNWSPVEFRAPAPTLNFMWAQGDPRIRMFYQKNNYSQQNINTAIAAGVLAPGTMENAKRYVGAPISPDEVAKVKSWFTLKKVNDQLSLDTVSYLQWRMFQPAESGGTGKSFFTLISYADELFMRAELAARGVTSENAQDLYYKGIEASLRFFDQAAAAAKLPDYTPLTDAEIAAYKAAPAIVYNPAKAVEQIVVQAFINFFKQPNEAWALYKRTGMPNATTSLANENIMIDGTLYQIPRRAAITAPSSSDLNAANKQAAIDDMMKDPDFGTSIEDLYGRIWWDKK